MPPPATRQERLDGGAGAAEDAVVAEAVARATRR
jgi:hypothetical protein